MIIQILDQQFELPNNRLEVTLGQRIQYDVDFGDAINEAIVNLEKEIAGLKEEEFDEAKYKHEQDVIYLDRCQKTLAFFSGRDLEQIKTLPTDHVIELFEKHLQDIIALPEQGDGVSVIEWENYLYWLPDPVVRTGMFTVSELVNSREICRNMSESNSQKLLSIAFLSVIFLRKEGEVFLEKMLDSEGEKFKWILGLPVDVAMQTAFFYDEWIDYIDNNYSVFQKSKIKSLDLTPHFKKWGWISFLNYVAKNGQMFYRNNGLTNLDNIKQADLHEVLTWASCDKDLEELIAKQLEMKEKKSKSSHQ